MQELCYRWRHQTGLCMNSHSLNCNRCGFKIRSVYELESHHFGQAGWLASPRDPPASTVQYWNDKCRPPCQLFHGCWNSGPHAGLASILSRVISPVSTVRFENWNINREVDNITYPLRLIYPPVGLLQHFTLANKCKQKKAFVFILYLGQFFLKNVITSNVNTGQEHTNHILCICVYIASSEWF